MSSENKFLVGDIVTFKTHPLLYKRKIQGDEKLVPPFMVVKEVLFEDKKKKIIDSASGKKIGERIKYNCLFFDDNKNEFKEVMVYQKMLKNYLKSYTSRLEGHKKEGFSKYESLINEVSNYENPKYKYGKLVCFKTKKLELFKKRTSTKKTTDKNTKEVDEKITTQYVVNYSTPDFIICGYKKEVNDELYYPNGNIKKIASEHFYKVKWFNSNQMKFSEQFLPYESLVNKKALESTVSNKSDDSEDVK